MSEVRTCANCAHSRVVTPFLAEPRWFCHAKSAETVDPVTGAVSVHGSRDCGRERAASGWLERAGGVSAVTRFAADTSVSVSASKVEIERIIERYGAGQFMSGWSAEKAVIAFAMEGRQVRFVLPMPPKDDPEFSQTPTGKARAEQAAYKAWEQSCRQRWRALALVIKAKLEAVESGISVFEDEFMANIVLPGGRTVSEEVRPRIAEAYEGGHVGPLLPDYSGDA